MIRRRSPDPSAPSSIVSTASHLPVSPASLTTLSAGRLEQRGRLVARILAGSWSNAPAPLDFTEAELASITPQLYQSGEAALAWWRIRNSELATTQTGLLLRDAWRHLRLAARLHEREIKNVFALLRHEGIEPVLVKGWASARLYPDAALRPYGDIDLCVRPDQFARAAKVIQGIQNPSGPFVDLHDGFASIGKPERRSSGQSETQANDNSHHQLTPGTRHLTPDTWTTLFNRSRLVPLSDEQPDVLIRILSDEDHLLIICLHLLQSGGWRPLWLCDVAVALESIKDEFDWTICLGQDERQAEWTAATIALADELLISRQSADGSRQESASWVTIHRAPASCRLPPAAWLRAAVLRHWGRVRPADRRAMHLGQLLLSGLSVGQLIDEVYARWDNPVRATVNTRGRINQWPRLPYQLGELLRRAPELPRQLGTRFLVSFSPRL